MFKGLYICFNFATINYTTKQLERLYKANKYILGGDRMLINALEVKKERLQEVRLQLKKYLKGQYNCLEANMLKAERDRLKAEVKEMESRREEKAYRETKVSSIGDNPEESKIILEHNQIGFDL